MLSPHWGRAATGKKKKSLACMHARSCSTLYGPMTCDLPGFSVRGGLQARILECIGQYWLPYISRALYFLLALDINSPEYLVQPESLQTQAAATASTAGPHWGRTKSSRATSGAKRSKLPVDDPNAEVKVKPQWKPRGRPKSSRAAANPSARHRGEYRGGNKTTVETQGQGG